MFEADPRHVDMIIKGVGLVNGKGSDVVGSDVLQSEGEEELCKEDAFKFRSLAARCKFLSMDRPDFAVRLQGDLPQDVASTVTRLDVVGEVSTILGKTQTHRH